MKNFKEFLSEGWKRVPPKKKYDDATLVDDSVENGKELNEPLADFYTDDEAGYKEWKEHHRNEWIGKKAPSLEDYLWLCSFVQEDRDPKNPKLINYYMVPNPNSNSGRPSKLQFTRSKKGIAVRESITVSHSFFPPWVDEMTSVAGTLGIHGNISQKDLDRFKNLTRVGTLYITSNNQLKSLTGLENLKQVSNIEIRGTELTDISQLNNIETKGIQLTIRQCPGITSLKQIEKILTNCSQIQIFDCHNIKSLEGLENVKILERLQLQYLAGLVDISQIQNIKKIKTLYFTKLPLMKDLSPIKKIKKIESASIDEVGKYKQILKGIMEKPTDPSTWVFKKSK